MQAKIRDNTSIKGVLVPNVPGHCAGQVALLWRPGRMLFAADVCKNIMGPR